MMRRNVTLKLITLAALCGPFLLQSAPAQGPAGKPPEPRWMLMEKAAKARCEKSVEEHRRVLKQAGTPTRMKSFAEAITGMDEKIKLGTELLQSNKTGTDRMRAAFRKHALDDREFSSGLATAYNDLQLKLMKESVELCTKAGVAENEIISTFRVWKLNEGAWSNSFDYCINRARGMAKEDVVREAGQFAGGMIAAELAEGVGRRTGLWQHEESSWSNLFARLATQVVADVVIEQVTDPVGQISKKLTADFEACSQVCIDGKYGFAYTCRELTQHHLEARRKLLGVARKVVK